MVWLASPVGRERSLAAAHPCLRVETRRLGGGSPPATQGRTFSPVPALSLSHITLSHICLDVGAAKGEGVAHRVVRGRVVIALMLDDVGVARGVSRRELVLDGKIEAPRGRM